MSTENQNQEAADANSEAANDIVKTNDVVANLEGSQEDITAQTAPELNDEVVSSYLKSKGRDFDKLEDLFNKPQVVENPYASIIEDAEIKSILDYKKETGRSFSDYQELQRNIDDIPLIKLALGQAKKDIGGNVSEEDLTAYIEDELGVDLANLDELTTVEKLKLQKFSKNYKEELAAEKEKYKTPIAKANQAPVDTEEMVTLEGGQRMPKAIYDEQVKTRQTYLENTKAAVDSVAKTSLNIEFDNNGTKETLTYDYEFDAEDKKSMFSLAEDVDATVARLFRTDKGFDHEAFTKAIYRLDPKNWEKEVSAIVNKARAEAIEEVLKTGNNVNYNANSLQSQQAGKEGVRMVPVKELLNR